MKFAGCEKIQKGKAGFFVGVWPNILSGAYEVEAYVCEKCHRIEFYAAEDSVEAEMADGGISRVLCPYCGVEHDLDDAVCPRCGRRLQEL